MSTERITAIHVSGMRTLADVKLELGGLTVLIGENGSGKSSLVEACELLRRAAGEAFSDELQQVHGGLGALLRAGASQLSLGLEMTAGSGFSLRYSFTLLEGGVVGTESLVSVDDDEEPPYVVLSRHHDSFKYQADDLDDTFFEKRIDPRRLALTYFGESRPHWMMRAVAEALRSIDVHLPFDTLARWAQRSRGGSSAIRGTATLEPAASLSRFGYNLANAFNTLKNDFSEAHWRETMDYVRLGLGYDVESVNIRADPGGGAVALRLKYAGLDEQIPAFSLSDGMLSYLSFVALFRLNATKSLIAFDEPETHLHPEMLMRVLGFFETLAEERPVLLATHSDRLLDGLSDPARSVVLCELDERRATRLVRPDPEALADWLEDYRGLGDIRSAGHAASVLTRRDP